MQNLGNLKQLATSKQQSQPQKSQVNNTQQPVPKGTKKYPYAGRNERELQTKPQELKAPSPIQESASVTPINERGITRPEISLVDNQAKPMQPFENVSAQNEEKPKEVETQMNKWLLDKLLFQIKEINMDQKAQLDELQKSQKFALSNSESGKKQDLASSGSINKLANSSNLHKLQVDEYNTTSRSYVIDYSNPDTDIKFKFKNTFTIMQQCINYNMNCKKGTFLIYLNDIYKQCQSTYSQYLMMRLINYTIKQPYAKLEEKYDLYEKESLNYFVQNLPLHFGPSQIVNKHDVHIKNFIAIASGFKFVGWNRKRCGIIGQPLISKLIFQNIDDYIPINPEFSIFDNFNIFSREVVFNSNKSFHETEKPQRKQSQSQKYESPISWAEKGIQATCEDETIQTPKAQKPISQLGNIQNIGGFKKAFNVMLQSPAGNSHSENFDEIDQEAAEPPGSGITQTKKGKSFQEICQPLHQDYQGEQVRTSVKKEKFLNFNLSNVSDEQTDAQEVIIRDPSQFDKNKAYDLLAVFEKGVRYTVQGNIRVAIIQGLYQRPAKINIANGKGLQALSLSNCKLESNVENYDNLKTLSLYQVQDFNPQDLLMMNKLKRLYVNGTNILLQKLTYQTRLETLYNCNELEIMYLINTGIQNILFFDLKMPLLQTMYISEPKIEKMVIDSKLSNLDSLLFLFVGEQTTSWSSVNTTDELEDLNTKVAYTVYKTSDKYKTQFCDKRLKNIQFFGNWNLPELLFLQCKNAHLFKDKMKTLQ